MRSGSALCAALLLVDLVLVSRAAAAAIAVPPDLDVVPLGRHLEVLEDPERRFAIEEVSAPPLAKRFVASSHRTLNFGMTRSAYWVRIDLENPSDRDIAPRIAVQWPLTDELDLFVGRPDGGFQVQRAGDVLPFTARAMSGRIPAFLVDLPPASTRTVWLRFAGTDALLAPLVLASEEGLWRAQTLDAYRFGAYYGMLLILGVYNLALFFAVGDRSYLQIVLLGAAAVSWQLCVDGLAAQYLWPGSPWWANHAIGVFGPATCLAFIVFVRSFLLTRQHSPVADRVLRVLLVAAPVLAIAGLVDLRWLNVLALPFGTVLFGASVAAALQAWRSGFAPGRDFLVAYSFALACLILYGADATFGLFQSRVVQTFGLHAGFLGSAVLLSLALGRRVQVLERESRQADRLRLEKEDADRANEAKSRFLAAASHDLRQPLHALGLFVGSLDYAVREPRARELVARIQASHRAMEQMFDAVLDVSKLDAGVLEPELREFALRELLARLAEEFGPQAESRGLRLRVMPTALWSRSDPLILLRILRNLVANALRYTEAGRITLGVRRDGERMLRIEVYDTGRGIPEDRLHEIFEEFKRIEPEMVEGGLGLGLSIVDRLARLLDHEVSVRSAPGRGSVFAVRVPRVAPSSRETREPTPSPGAGLAGHRILVVDDDPRILDGMRDLLGRWGCHVATARSPDEALRAGAEGPTDAVVADYDLGVDQTGVDVIASLRERAGRELPAVLITGDTSPCPASEASARGIVLLGKPVSPGRLRAALTRLLRRHEAGG